MSPSKPHRRARSQTTVPHWCNNSGVNSTPSLPGTPCQTVLRVNQSNVGVGFGPSVHAPLEGFLLQQQGGPFSSPCGADRRRRCLAPDPAAWPGAEAAVLPPAPAARPGEGAPRLPPTNAAQPGEEAAALPPAPAARPGEGARGRNVRPGAPASNRVLYYRCRLRFPSSSSCCVTPSRRREPCGGGAPLTKEANGRKVLVG